MSGSYLVGTSTMCQAGRGYYLRVGHVAASLQHLVPSLFRYHSIFSAVLSYLRRYTYL